MDYGLLLAAVVLLAASEAHAQTVNRIVAVVNEEVITEQDIRRHLAALVEKGALDPSDEADLGELQRAVLRHLIEQRLILQEAKRTSASVTQDDVTERLDAFRSRFGSEEAFRRSLAETALSLAQLQQQIREQLMIQRVIDASVRAGIVVSPQEIAQALAAHPELARPGERRRASHLLIRVTDERSEEAARALIEELSRRLRQGEEFSQVAAQYADDAQEQTEGEMGWVARGQLLPELDQALFSLKVGECSLPIQTRLGFHLLRVEEERDASALSLIEANRAVYEQLYQQKFERAMAHWLDGLKRRAYIELVP